MKRLAFVVCSTALLAGSLVTVAAPAHAATPHILGSTCGFATTDYQSAGTWQYGFMWGGPIVMRDPGNVQVLYTGTMTCTLKYYGFNNLHSSGGTVCQATGGPATGVVAVQPVSCNFPADPASPQEIYICTRVVIGATAYYFSGGGWTMNANAECERSTFVTANDGQARTLLHDLLDPIICPVLAPFFPPDGDVGIFWDCPPYGNPPSPLFQYLAYFEAPSIVT